MNRLSRSRSKLLCHHFLSIDAVRRPGEFAAIDAGVCGIARAREPQWSQREGGRRSPRVYQAMAHDTGRGVTVLFGGYQHERIGQTWEHEVAAWAQRMLAGPSLRNVVARRHPLVRRRRPMSTMPDASAARTCGSSLTARTTAAAPSKCGLGRRCPYNAVAATNVVSGTKTYVRASGRGHASGFRGAFFGAWEAGEARSDVNADGGIDGADVNSFHEHWQASC